MKSLSGYQFTMQKQDICPLVPFDAGISRANEWYLVTSQLSTAQPYADFNLHLAPNIANLIHNELHIDTPSEYRKFGVSDDLHTEVEAFIETLSASNRNVSTPIADLIINVTTDILTFMDSTYDAFIVLRGSKTNDENSPAFRWHTDPCLNDHCIKDEVSFAFTLKGPSTVFYNLPADLHQESVRIDGQLTIPNHLIDITQVQSAQFGYGTVFMMGEGFGAVHAVPKIEQERLFAIIVLSGKDSIQSIRQKIEQVESNMYIESTDTWHDETESMGIWHDETL